MVTKNYFWQMVSAVLLIILLMTCKRTSQEQTVIVTPEKKGSFQSIVPEPIKVPKYIYHTLKGDTIVLPNPVNDSLAHKYEVLLQEHDSLKLRLAYLDAIQIHKYNKAFQDKNLKVFVHAQTTGTLDSLKLDYVIKQDSIKVDIPRSPINLFIGAGVHDNASSYTGFKFNIGVQTRKGDLMIAGYDPFHKNLFIDYNFKIFSFK